MATDSKKSKTTDWAIFFVSLVITVGFLIFEPTWFWLFLPFVLTYYVKAIDYM